METFISTEIHGAILFVRKIPGSEKEFLFVESTDGFFSIPEETIPKEEPLAWYRRITDRKNLHEELGGRLQNPVSFEIHINDVYFRVFVIETDRSSEDLTEEGQHACWLSKKNSRGSQYPRTPWDFRILQEYNTWCNKKHP